MIICYIFHFFSLIKMVFAFSAKTGKKPSWFQLKHAIMRNFGGLDNVDAVDLFKKCLRNSTMIMNERVGLTIAILVSVVGKATISFFCCLSVGISI